MTYVLWIIQVLLGLLFLFAGGMKLIVPVETLASMGSPNQVALPGLLLKFIGLCEVLGGLGLIFPGLLKIRPELTWIAATGLVIIMLGATAITFAGDGLGASIVPFITAALCAFVAYGRCRLAPHSSR